MVKTSASSGTTTATPSIDTTEPRSTESTTAVVTGPRPRAARSRATRPAAPPPAAAQPVPSVFDAGTLGAIRGRLTAHRAELEDQLREIEEAAFTASQSDISGDVSYDEGYADAGTFTFEREKDLSIARNVRDLLEKMAKALHKIDDGTYGVCEGCGEPIDAARVKALPHVLLCLECKKAEERR